MKLSKAEFDKRLDARALRLSFIGMSNIGKSFTAMRLRKAYGFSLYEVDEAIQTALDLKSMQESADWMGFPYDGTYAAREAEYMALESDLTVKALERYSSHQIIDTTGSVIYTDKATQKRLKEQTIIVHIQAGPENLTRLKKLYSRAPKPLIWAGQYKPWRGEDRTDALIRCYPALLASRMDAYNALADVNLPASLLFEGTTMPDDIMDYVRENLG